MRPELLKGHLDLLLLTIVADEPAHGYAIIEALRRRSEGVFDLPEGTVYPALHRLERAGLLSGRWVDAGGRRRRIYELSGVGAAALKERRREWLRFATGIQSVVGGTA
ncbi:MAG: helix-turn-helix transcriptional regulator [Dehalococcoidia bacterium]